MSWKWPNFKPEEVLSPEGLMLLGRGILVIQPIFLDALESFRAYVNKPLLINHHGMTCRGYRSPFENKKVKGDAHSFHTQGLAADISCYELSVEELHKSAITFGFHGIGFYPSKNFVHCDLRPRLDETKVAFWTVL